MNFGIEGIAYPPILSEARARQIFRLVGSIPTTDLTGTLQAAQFPALTGDVTTVAGALASTVATVGGSSAVNINSAELLANAATALATANAILKRDANANAKINVLATNVLATVTSAGTLTLTVASAQFLRFNGTNVHQVNLPDATTLVVGHPYFLSNISTGAITVKNPGGTTLATVPAQTNVRLTCTSIGNANGAWDVAWGTINASALTTGTLALLNGGTGADLSATGGANQFLLQSSSGAAITVGGIVSADLTTALLTPPAIGTTTPAAFKGTTGTFTDDVKLTKATALLAFNSSSTVRLESSGATALAGYINNVLWFNSSGSSLLTIQYHNFNFVKSAGASPSTPIELLTLQPTATGTPTAGSGNRIGFKARSSTTNDRDMGRIDVVWNTTTDAGAIADIVLQPAYNPSGVPVYRDALRVQGGASGALIGVLGATPSARITVSGSRGSNAALASLLTALATFGWITDSTS